MGRNSSASSSASSSAASLVLGANHAMTSAALPRACYAIMSANSSSTAHEAVFLDAEFRQVAYSTQSASNGTSGSRDAYDTTYTGTTQKTSTNGGSGTQTYPSTSGSANWINATNSAGEFGTDGGWASERGLIGNTMQRTWNGTQITASNYAFVNSDHADRSKALLLTGGRLKWRKRWAPLIQLMPNGDGLYEVDVSPHFGAGTRITSMTGSASYNKTRKELAIVSYNTTAPGQFDIRIYKGLDLDALDGDISGLAAPSASFSVNVAGIGQWTGSTAETQQRPSPVLCNNGDMYISMFFPSSSQKLFKIVRAGDDLSGVLTMVDSVSCTTSYGMEQGGTYGQKTQQSRDGRMVISYCPYYYYGSGLRSFTIDKLNSLWVRSFNSTDSSYGHMIVPYGDSGFASYYAGNYYAGNPQGSYVEALILPGSTGQAPTSTALTIYLPVAPGPNTTNYPGLTQVWEYAMQSALPY